MREGDTERIRALERHLITLACAHNGHTMKLQTINEALAEAERLMERD